MPSSGPQPASVAGSKASPRMIASGSRIRAQTSDVPAMIV